MSPMEIPKLHDSSLPVFLILWYMLLYILGYFILFKNWDKRYRPEASSCLMSLAHGSLAPVLSIFSILQSQKSITKIDFTFPNTPFQNLVLEYSIAYFCTDLLHYMVFNPGDVLFIAHHLGTLYVLATCRYVIQHGAVAILGVLVLAEVTSICQNTWSLARHQKGESAKAASVFDFLSPIFYAYYSVVRGILGPMFVCGIVGVFSSGAADGVIPRWAWISWIVVMVSGIGASILWVVHLWIDLCRQISKKELKKSS
ncbi:TLC domain-containing protein At5g14285-like [Andrographis paniculata]|uniref:TLC domain-containing protein At5g14285-like n=1 Tax=Andrographis paniculata TaxID=175694 RepID=UPI0021E90D74|nr:TLC domain-containing protein At5g14285-like [Andrographis paniculata]